jgi:methylmalonyl-CoA mutase N-terminal domain/subunit
MESEAWKLVEKIDAMGGSVAAIEQGFIQNEIAQSAYVYQRKIEAQEKIIVGVNKFKVGEENTISVFKVDDNIRSLQIEKLKKLKETRNNTQAQNCLYVLRKKAVTGENLMPAIIDAVENYCTLGEIADELRQVFGEYK